ncbi:MAG: hypothetical protein QM538_06340 [Methylacidiphilales bacterium]|nr:hypothetical protein [Candidatus Methylacidiphilales bacterium]
MGKSKIQALIRYVRSIYLEIKIFTFAGGLILVAVKFVIFWIPIVGVPILFIWWLLAKQKASNTNQNNSNQ